MLLPVGALLRGGVAETSIVFYRAEIKACVLQEMHVRLLFPSPSVSASSPLTIRSHKQSVTTKVSKLDQAQDVWLCPQDVKSLPSFNHRDIRGLFSLPAPPKCSLKALSVQLVYQARLCCS